MKHGNELDHEKHITCELCLYERYVELSVADEGPGFDVGNVRDPLAEENLLRDSGRGLYFIRHFTDEISYEKHPSIVRLRFYFEPVE
jgi:serine/threonine-protein kinase RsbW